MTAGTAQFVTICGLNDNCLEILDGGLGARTRQFATIVRFQSFGTGAQSLAQGDSELKPFSVHENERNLKLIDLCRFCQPSLIIMVQMSWRRVYLAMVWSQSGLIEIVQTLLAAPSILIASDSPLFVLSSQSVL